MTVCSERAPTRSETRSGLALHAQTLVAFLAASSVPAPLYPLYQAQWQFSDFALTLIFAVYALTLLVGLLFFGTMSNRFGRRPVILLALALQLAAMSLFLLAHASTWLIAARIVQGFATGLATTALAAALLDLDQKVGATINSISPMVGMGVGGARFRSSGTGRASTPAIRLLGTGGDILCPSGQDPAQSGNVA